MKVVALSSLTFITVFGVLRALAPPNNTRDQADWQLASIITASAAAALIVLLSA